MLVGWHMENLSAYESEDEKIEDQKTWIVP